MDHERKLAHSQLADSYQTYMKHIDTDKEDSGTLWDSLQSQNSSVDGSFYGYKSPMNFYESGAIDEAVKDSLTLAKIIEDNENEGHQESKNCTKLCLLWIFSVLILSASSVAIWVLTRNYEMKILQRKAIHTIENSNYIPLFLSIPGTGAPFLPSALSSCLGLREAKLLGDIANVSDSIRTLYLNVFN